MKSLTSHNCTQCYQNCISIRTKCWEYTIIYMTYYCVLVSCVQYIVIFVSVNYVLFKVSACITKCHMT
jgi:hypothetical protein